MAGGVADILGTGHQMKRIISIAALVACLILAAPIFAAEGGGEAGAAIAVPHGALVVESLELHLALASMGEAGAPRIIDNNLVLSAKGPYRYVAVAFASENYAKLHSFDRNRQGVFVFAMPVPLKSREPIAYRLVIDGVWTFDPRNPLRAESASGVSVSLAQVPYLSDEKPGLYSILGEDGRTAHFLFKGESGMYVTVAGSFDNWDPFLYEMAETRPGVYELVLALPPGRHYYAFYFDGAPHPDPLNQEKATSKDGVIVSTLLVRP